MYADLRVNDVCLRFVSVYLPHTGYSWEHNTQIVEHIEKTIVCASRKHCRCIIGGDFNVVFGALCLMNLQVSVV